MLIILTTVDGLIENFGKADPKTIVTIENLDERIEKMAGGTHSETAVGGMASKLQAAKIVVRAGIPLVIASGKKKSVLANILEGCEEGTIFVAQTAKLAGRKRWIAFFHHSKGALSVDEGAKRCAKMARAFWRLAWRVAKASLPPAKWCASAISTGPNLPAAFVTLIQRPSRRAPPKACWFIAIIW
jgi:glutamate 5-kinase